MHPDGTDFRLCRADACPRHPYLPLRLSPLFPATATVAAAKADLAQQAEASRSYLGAESDRLAEEITDAVLGGKAA